jgi:hypothetical protein
LEVDKTTSATSEGNPARANLPATENSMLVKKLFSRQRDR